LSDARAERFDWHPIASSVKVPLSMERAVHVRPGRTTRKQIWVATIGLAFIYLCVGLAIRYPALGAKVPISGDEQHYVTQALSLLKDGDLVVVDNYARGDYLQFYGNVLDPSLWNLVGLSGYSGHSPGTGLLIVPGIAVGGWAGVLATLAASIAATFAMTASTLARLRRGPLPAYGLVLLAAGFVALPLLAYSHSLYPETFMALIVAALALMTVRLLQTTVASHRRLLSLAAISISGLSMSLHPKYFVVLIGVTCFCIYSEFKGALNRHDGVPSSPIASYVGVALVWLWLFSWVHDVMWDAFHPAGWWVSARDLIVVAPIQVIRQLLDLLFGRELGILVLVPMTLLSLVFVYSAFRRSAGTVERDFAIFAIILSGAIIGPAALSQDWHGGASPLGRYAAPLAAILLLTSVHVAIQGQRAWGGRYLAFIVGLGLIQSLTYSAAPLSFFPHLADGSGALAVLSDRVGVFSDSESWFWSGLRSIERPPLVGVLVWVLLIGLALWIFAQPDDPSATTNVSDRFEIHE
jgi:hypothetical protein